MDGSQGFRFGVLGYGKIARTRFIPSLLQIGSAKLAAVGTRNPDGLGSDIFLPATPRVMSYEELIRAGRDLVDGVYIALPNDLHEEWALRSLDAGLHVLCEKPLTANHDSAIRCQRAALDRSVLLAEGFMYRLDPRHRRIQDILQSGQIGEVHLLEACFSYCLTDLNNIRLQADRHGGALMDVGCYGIDAARLIFQAEPSDVTAVGIHGRESGVDELTTAILRFPGGAVATVTASTRLTRRNICRISGTRGAVTVPNAFIPKESESTQVIIESASGERSIEEFARFNAFALEISHFTKAAMANDRGKLAPLEDGVANASVLNAAACSLQEFGWDESDS